MNKKTVNNKTPVFYQFIFFWSIMYFLGLFLFPFRYPNTKMEGDVYNDFFFLLLQFTIASFIFYKLIRGDWLGNKNK